MAHVLVVDDEPGVRDVVQLALEDFADWRVTCAATGGDAVAVLENDPPDLAVLDLRMPGEGYLGLAHRAAELDVAVLFMTGDHDAAIALEDGGLSVLSKPFHLDALRRGVEEAIAASRAIRLAARDARARHAETSAKLEATLARVLDTRMRLYPG